MRERRRVVHAVADHRDSATLGLQLLHGRGLVLGAHAGEEPVDAELGGDGCGDGFRVTGDHHDLHAPVVEGGDGVARFRADLVRETQRAGDLAVDEDVQDDGSLAPPALSDRQLAAAFLLEQIRAADLHRAVADTGPDPDGRGGLESGGCRNHQLPLACGGDDGAGERVFRVGFCGSGQTEQFVGSDPGHGFDRGHGGGALGEGAGLVEQHRVDGAHALQGEAVLDQHTRAGGALGGDRHHQWDRETESVRAGDDEDGDGAHHGLVRHPEQCPHGGGDRGGDQREPEQPAGGTVGEALCAGGGVLRLGDQSLDAGERGVVADRGDLHPQPGVGRDGPGDDRVAGAAADRAGTRR